MTPFFCYPKDRGAKLINRKSLTTLILYRQITKVAIWKTKPQNMSAPYKPEESEKIGPQLIN